MESDGDNHWLLHMNVCSYVGIGRFVLGLYDDIEVLESNDYRDYLRQKVENMSKDRQQQLITH
jgi:predicted DNA-binding transcriptional regulator YafY